MNPDPGTPTLAAQTREILTRHPDLELRFVQQRRTGTVHVLVPVNPDTEPEHVRGRIDWIGWLRDNRPAVCGYRARALFDADADSDQYVSEFPDSRLCGRCHRALGSHSDRAFEHPQPSDDDGEHDNRGAPGKEE